ncbi:hypothetical protein NA56DRAFT_696320 [Hyaloscypha hepaticicola]|uniref:FAD-binding domain-containing protein n=1 Tax=Hyaloscypha hepaticicola TaxID=2082293 RepID=A0A2J6QQK5_9HELO|nr:hypothetical protein NA56DRAFT_696320 [Hyaloscypha hepaticicola]
MREDIGVGQADSSTGQPVGKTAAGRSQSGAAEPEPMKKPALRLPLLSMPFQHGVKHLQNSCIYCTTLTQLPGSNPPVKLSGRDMGDIADEHKVVQNHNPVLIIGSGCTGLALAQGLKKAGIPVIVFEKHAALFSPG